MNLFRLLPLLLVFAHTADAVDRPSRVGDVLWSYPLDNPAELQTGSGGGEIIQELGRGNVLWVTNRNPLETVVRTFTLPLEMLRGRFVFMGAEVKAENVSAKSKPWNGIKLMARIDTPAGPQWPQAEIPVGSFGWQRVSTRIFVPPNATAVTLVLGLEQVSGRVAFDEVRLTLARDVTTVLDAPVDRPIFRGHSLTRLRGTMVSP